MPSNRLIVLITAAAAAVLPPSVSAADDRPNIVIIMSDDMGFSDLGCYGGEIRTPNLDRLAAGGLRFTQFYNTGRCCPTRASLLTGLYPHQAGVGHMMEDRGYDGYRGDLGFDSVTIAEVLKSAGYGTYAVGKWHVTRFAVPEGPKHNWPLQRGFDRFYGTITGAGSFYDPGTLTRDNTMISPFADPQYRPEVFYYTDAISDHAVRFINEHFEQHGRQPLLMYVAYTCAHWPMHALEEDIAAYKGVYDGGYDRVRQARLARLRQMGLVDPNWEPAPTVGNWNAVEHLAWEIRCMEVYAAMITRMDAGIGRIIQALDRKGQLHNTLVFFLQDNGGCQEGVGRKGDQQRPVAPSLPPIALDAVRLDVIPKQNRAGVLTLMGPHVMPGPEDTYIAYGIDWANVSNTPFREYKHFVHEGGIATPLIAYWPAGIKRAGELEHQPGHLVDLMATCVEVAKASYPEQFDGQEIQPPEGVSLVPAFNGKPLERTAPIFWEHEGNRAIRRGKWKLVAKENQPWELYDMEKDRPELHDLASTNPELVAELAAQWDAWAERAKVLPLGAWRGEKQADKFSQKKRFALAADADLPPSEAPYVPGKALMASVQVRRWGEGVLVAQGGSSHGYSLYVQGGKLHFATRHGGRLSLVTAGDRLPPAPCKVSVLLRGTGEVTLRAGEALLGKGQVPGPLSSMPGEGLQVGRDLNGAVGPYEAPFAFQGELAGATVRLEPEE